MPELRDLLQQAAGTEPPSVPLADIRRRGARLVRRRRVVAGLVTLVAALAVAAALTTYWPVPDIPATPPPRPVVTAGPLTPGRYVDTALDPPVAFTVSGSGWRIALATTTELTFADDSLPARVSIQHWTSVQPPVTGAGPAPARSPRPPDVIGWLADHPGLRVLAGPAPTILGGLRAHQITVAIDPHRLLPIGPALGCANAADCLPLAGTPDNPFVAMPDYSITVAAPDHDSTGLVVTVVAPAEHLAEAAQLVDTLTFD